MRSRFSHRTCFLLSTLLLAAASPALSAEIEDSQTIGLFSDEQPVAAPSPVPRPTSKIAENVTVVSAEEILRLNAHTVAEVLQTVPGIQLDFHEKTPGNVAFFSLQGAINSTVLILVDGVRQNDFDQDVAWPGLMPVQQIERIEIVKGAASGSWGSALGGVVNIVTKSPNPERPVSGVVSGSIGSRFTADNRGELSGAKGSFGYYLTAGRLRSDGLNPGTDNTQDNLYGKLSYTLPRQGTATVGVSQMSFGGGMGEGTIPGFGFLRQDLDSRHTYGFLKFQQPLPDRFSFDLLGYLLDNDDRAKNSTRDSGGAPVDLIRAQVATATRGANATVTWGDSRNNVVAGLDYLHGHGSSRDLSTNIPIYDRTWDSWAAYLNGSYSIGDFSILPGVRFDSTGISGNQTSYTLGVTYQLTERTTLRAYAAKGFSLPMLVNQTATQKVKTVQAGVETVAVPFVWLKGTYFFNDLHDVQSVGRMGNTTVTNQHRQGFELEARTTSFYGFTLSGAYTYLHAADEETSERLQTNGQQSVPPQVYKLALHYDESDLGLKGALTGSGTVWNASPGYPARSDFMLWDLNLSWKPGLRYALTPELFFTVRNLFSGVQSNMTFLFDSTGRWYEGGARFRF